MSLKGKNAIVTGSTSGIGLAIAKTLAGNGCNIMVNGMGEKAAIDGVVADIAATGVKAVYSAADMSKAADIRKMVADCTEQLGSVDILINNAGATWGAPAEDHPIEAWDKVMNLNVRGYFLMSQAVGKKSMIPRKSGRIINIASIAGLAGNPPEMTMIAYNTSKGAVINFTRALCGEWGRYNINVNAICPGFFPSKMTAGTLKAMGEERLASHAPLKRLGDDEDLKGLTLLYASDAGKHITGQWLAVDGGVSAVLGG
jgi:gluconate 5-dehydrogenase